MSSAEVREAEGAAMAEAGASAEVVKAAEAQEAMEQQEEKEVVSVAVCNSTLEKFEQACQVAANVSFKLATLAAKYVAQFLGASKEARRTTAIENLADTWRKWDEDSMSMSLSEGKRRMLTKVNNLLRVHAVICLVGDGRGVPKGDGTGKGRGKDKDGSGQPLNWTILREFAPLVVREDNEYAENWSILEGMEQPSKDLLEEVARSGLKRADVSVAVGKLVKEGMGIRLKAAREALRDNPTDGKLMKAVERAEKDFELWGGRVERQEKKAKEDKAPPITPAPATDETPASEKAPETPPPGAVTNPPGTDPVPQGANDPSVSSTREEEGKSPKSNAALVQAINALTVSETANLLVQVMTAHQSPKSLLKLFGTRMSWTRDLVSYFAEGMRDNVYATKTGNVGWDAMCDEVMDWLSPTDEDESETEQSPETAPEAEQAEQAPENAA